ncbi:MAG: type II secretion system F family protein [Promethearchaeota archaeon]
MNISAWFKKVAYLHVGRRLDSYIESGYFDNLEKALRKAGIESTLPTYLGIAILTAIVIGGATLAAGIVASLLLLLIQPGQPFGLVFLFSVVLAPVLAGVVILYFYSYVPTQKANSRRKNLEQSLSIATSYMLAMATAGVVPDKIFSSLRNPELPPAIIEEATKIDRDLEAFGFDILEALEVASNRSPSEKWNKFLQGIIATVNAGGDFVNYLTIENKAFMKDQEESTKEFIEQLGVAAEIFMVLGVVAPLFLIIMIAILGTIGGGVATTQILLKLFLIGLVYIVVPILMGFMIVLVDGLE